MNPMVDSLTLLAEALLFTNACVLFFFFLSCAAPESGVVIGKNVNPSASNGHRIIHIGVVAKGSFASQVDDGHR